jgi:hypothetical protein
MCGRYGRRADKQRIAEWMQTHNVDVFDESYLAPSYSMVARCPWPWGTNPTSNNAFFEGEGFHSEI